MAANSYDFGVNLKINADTKLAVQQLESLKTQLSSVQAMKFNFSGVNALTSEINKASSAALVLQQNLQAALNPATGNLNFSKFNASILGAGQTVDGLAESLLSAGSQGTRAFNSLTESVIRSEIPLLRTNKAVAGLWDNLKKTAGWQLSSSMIHGFIGGVQQAVGYAQALDKSLTNIRIVTGQSAEQMAQFAKEANVAARRLSTTTTDYTNASLIYYQQGLSAAEVKKRADVTLKMANVSGQSAERVADQMTAIWNNFDDGTKSMEHYADVMTALGAATASSSQEIAKGIQKFSAISETVGLSYEYAASALATITATTRESADTVGNSLKTLFSRIQGLQLGDTLDDGTTLNKYSTALAKVGISIKDASGALKDMDTILDDMGAKWHTLAEDQKMALAQTVGGVRQYTQIMTLMENWDFFKSNLGIAQGSAGTLQQQMDIFEDSWQGAQKRMKASWESLWDTLIDSDGFKKILNIGSTIVDGISKSLQGLGGMGGIFSGGALGFIGSGLGTIFKNQIATATDNAIFNVKSLLPSSRIAAENQRSELISSLSELVRSEYANPYMGAKEREVMANNIEASASEHLRFSQAMKHMSPLAQETYSQLDRQAMLIRDQQQVAAKQIDEGNAIIARNSIGKNNFMGVYTSKVSNQSMGQLTDFARALFGGQNISTIYDVATQFGERSADVLSEIEKIQSSITTGYQYQTPDEVRRGVLKEDYDINSLVGKDEIIKTDGGKELNLGIAYSGQAFKVLAKAYGLTEQEQAEIAGAQRGAKGVIDTGNKRLDTIAERIQKDLQYVSQTASNSSRENKSQQGTIIGDALRGRVSQIQQNVVSDLSKVKGAQKENIEGMIVGAQGVRQGQQAETDAQRMARENKERREALLQQQQSAGTILTNAGLGISSTATALTSAKGMMESFRNGNTLGGLTGLGSTIMNLSMGNRGIRDAVFGFTSKQATALQAETALGNTQKALEKYSQSNAASALKLQQERAQLEMQRNQPGANRFTTGLRSTMLSAQEQYNRLQGNIAGAGLNQVNQSLESLNNSNPNALARGLNKVSSGMNYLAQNAGAVATAVQVATIAYSVAKEKLTYIADTNKREAQQATSSATQLQAAYQMSKNNSIAFASSVNEYNKALDQLTDFNLTGAAKQQAIFDQNTLASDLISKYDIAEEDVSRVGDTIQIKESALRKKQEELISQTSVAKYAAEQAKLDAKEKQNEYDQESLERELGMDETGWFGAAAGAAGLAAGLGVFALLASGPVGWAVAGAALAGTAALGAAGIGGLEMKSRDQSIIDDILAESAARGGTSWLDNLEKDDIVNGNKISKNELKQIQEHREEIDKLYKNEQNARLQSERQKETIARDILSTNEETEDFKYADKLIDGLVEQQETWYTEDKLINYKKKKDSEVIADAKAIEAELGLAGKNVTWTNDKKNERLTYSYMENGQEQTGSLEYTALAETTAAAAGKKEADKYVGQMLETYNNLENIYGETAAAGMLSLLSGGDFESATIKEMEAAQDLINDFDLDVINKNNKEGLAERKRLAETLGIDTEGMSNADIRIAVDNYAKEAGYDGTADMLDNFKEMQNYTSAIQGLMENQFTNNAAYKDLFAEGTMGAEMFGSMDQATMKEFYSELSFIASTGGVDAGRAYINSLTGMLEGIDPDKMGDAIRTLTSVDWSDWDGLDTQVISILDEFDIKIDNSNIHLQNFINTIQTAAKSLPNLAESMTTLTQAAGQIKDLQIGDSIDDATLQALKDQGYDLSEDTFTTWDGKNILTSDISHIRQNIREEIADIYGTYMNTIDTTRDALGYDSDSITDEHLGLIIKQSQDEFLSQIGVDGITDNEKIAEAILEDGYDQFLLNKKEQETIQLALEHYRVEEDGTLSYREDVNTENWVTATTEQKEDYNTLQINRQANEEALAIQYNAILSAAREAINPEQARQIAEQYASTFDSFEDMLENETIKLMMDNGHLTESDALIAFASQYKELTDYVNAYNAALLSRDDNMIKDAEANLRSVTAMQSLINEYNKLNGVKITFAEMQYMVEKIRADMLALNEDYTPEEGELEELAAQTLAAADAYATLSKNYRKWSRQLDDDNANSEVAAQNIGNLLKTVLGLNDLTSLTSAELSEAVKAIDASDFGGIAALLRGDKAAFLEASEIIAKKSNGGYLERYIEDQAGTNKNLQGAIDAMQDFWIKQNIEGNISLKGLNRNQRRDFEILDQKLWEESGGDIEAYIAATEAAGYSSGAGAGDRGMTFTKYDPNTGYSYQIKGYMYHDGYGGYYYGDQYGNDLGTPNNRYGQNNPLNPNNSNPPWLQGVPSLGPPGPSSPYNPGGINPGGTNKPGGGLFGTLPTLPGFGSSGSGLLSGNRGISTPSTSGPSTGAPSMLNGFTPGAGTPVTDPQVNPTYTSGWGGGGDGGGGGGGGGPVEVAVKSAQEFMTRYKTIDQQLAIADAQKQQALNKKDLLYGEARIAQLQKINGLLLKQQQLTSDRIAEEMDYLEKDRERIKEVLKRYNEDLGEDEESIEFKFNSEGLITNYKQTIGKWAEEIASFYTDGEIDASEGEKQEELKKKIDDFNVVIQDYEDSLNQLNDSIRKYEDSLYELFENHVEELSYKIQYTIELEDDDMKYLDFYAEALKDSIGLVSDYIELMGNKISEFQDSIDVYDQGVKDLISYVENDPLQLWAAEGIEGMFTAGQIDSLRKYRDGLISDYQSAVLLRKEVENKVLKVFDHWHEKIDANIDNIKHFGGILSQFKDIVNVTGQKVLQLSDAFMSTFEQQTIEQSKDNIAALKKQYESLTTMYTDAKWKLEQAEAQGNEDNIKHWENVVNEIEGKMENAQEDLLSSLNDTLNLIAEQFSTAVENIIDDFNNSIYEFDGLDGLMIDYEQIREQRDLMVEDYEKIYSLNKLNRQLEKTIDDTKLIAGKQKLLEFQEKINELNKSNVELSRYELEYLEAEYELKLAEIELENARSSKDTVRLSRDSEGGWSYIYTQNETAIDEAEQKYEDALFKMQQLSRNYTEEMSSSMMDISQQMRDEIAELSIQDFASPEEYTAEINRIQEKYREQMAFRENELNKSIKKSAELYEEDWSNYSKATGYKLSASQDWIDSFSESTLGELLGSGSQLSQYTEIITKLTDTMNNELSQAAVTYFDNSNKALETYGSSLQNFGSTIQSTTSLISSQSKQAAIDVENMASDMTSAFENVAQEVKNWQDTFGEEIADLLDEIGKKIQEINNIIKESNELGKQHYGPTELIGQQEAVELLTQETAFINKDLFGSWTFDEDSEVTRHTYTDTKGESHEDVEQNLVEFNGELVELINKTLKEYANAKTGSDERLALGEKLKNLIIDYKKFKQIVDRIYDLTDITLPEPDIDDAEELATGGYTGEWGDSGKLAVLHEKELVLNKDDTANFLNALTISKQLVEMIEMNARQSSLGLGDMVASTIKDNSQTIEQQVHITAEFPDATDRDEIEAAFDNLINMASQYAFRSN